MNFFFHLHLFLFQSLSVLVMLSLGQFVKVIEMLYSMRHFDQAALFVEACQEFNLLPKNEETSILVVKRFLYLTLSGLVLHFHSLLG